MDSMCDPAHCGHGHHLSLLHEMLGFVEDQSKKYTDLQGEEETTNIRTTDAFSAFLKKCSIPHKLTLQRKKMEFLVNFLDS